MAKHISNMKDLEKALMPVMKGMVDTIGATVNNGELLKLAADYLRSKGFSVRV